MERDDLFKESFKYYKSSSANMTNVIDFEFVDVNSNNNIECFTSDAQIPEKTLQDVGLSETKNWKAYTVKDIPGLIFIKNPFTVVGQRYWVARSCRDFPKKPNKTNLDGLEEFSERDWWTICHRVDKKFLYKLRWSTLGYHHNWDTKIYTEENKSPFPLDLEKLTKAIATYVGHPKFQPEAAIVNYYYADSTLSGHTDHSEVNLVAPLFSFSFGKSAIFLIGGKTKMTRPHAILIKTGDVIVMTRESRLFYHGVPRIIDCDASSWFMDSEEVNQLGLNQENGEPEVMSSDNRLMELSKCILFWSTAFVDYIIRSRININVRQVLLPDQTRLE